MWTGRVKAGQRTPAVGEVAVEVNTASVATSVPRRSIRVQDRDEPQIDLTRNPGAGERTGDRDARPFIAVYASDHQHPVRTVRVPDLHGSDRAMVPRPADHADVLGGGVRDWAHRHGTGRAAER